MPKILAKTEQVLQETLKHLSSIDIPEQEKLRIAFHAGVDVSRSRQNKTTRTRNPYSQSDLARLQQMKDSGSSFETIARELGRSTGSIRGTIAYYKSKQTRESVSNA